MKEINILGIRKRAVLLRSKTPYGVELTIMEEITQKQEEQIDKSSLYYGELQYQSKHGIIHQKNIYLYGEINFNSQNDLDVIKRFNLVDADFESYMPSSFNYEKGIITPKDKIIKIKPTINPLEWFKYNYCLIGKPQRVIVYKLLKYMLND